MGGCTAFSKSRRHEDSLQDLNDLDSIINKIDSGMLPISNSTSERSTEVSRDSYVPDITASLQDFKRLKLLGRGCCSNVLLVQLATNKKLFAMKVIEKKGITKRKQIDHTKTERIMLEKLKHPFIVRLYYAFQDSEKLYFLTEFMQGGELFFHLRKNNTYRDKAVVFYMSEVLLAIEYMHQNNFIYRDLKPENILIDKNGHIKLTDFGLSKILEEDEKKTYTMCGTAEYLAPEIIFEKGYDKSCDWFSFGVVIYEMLVGYHLFPRKNNRIDPELYNKEIKFPNSISNHAKDLIKKLLCINPRKRLGYNGAFEIKNHKFFKDVDFDMVIKKQYIPPFIPKLNDEFDLAYFDEDFTSENIENVCNNNNYLNNNYDTDNGIPKSFDMFEGFSYQPSDDNDNICINNCNNINKKNLEFEDDNEVQYNNNNDEEIDEFNNINNIKSRNYSNETENSNLYEI